jgi:hypothetical protein
MKASVEMVFDDPSKFGLLATEVKKDVIKGGIGAVNVMAGRARKEVVKNIQTNFTNRNTFTARQAGFTPMPESKYIKISAIQSFVGIGEKASYMARQEEGGEHAPRQGGKLAIPTDAARGGSFRNRVKIKVRDIRQKRSRVRGESSARLPEYRGKGKISGKKKKITTHTRKSLLVSRAYIAFKHNLFLPMGGSGDNRNIFRVVSFKTVGTGRNRAVVFDTVQIYNFEHRKTMTKASPFLKPACEKVAKDAQKIFNSQMKKLGL